MVKRLAEDADLAAPRRRAGALGQVAGIDRRGDARHPPQRASDQRRDPGTGDDRKGERDAADQCERLQQALLRILHRGERIGNPQRADAPAASLERMGQHAHRAGLVDRDSREAFGSGQQPMAQFVLLVLRIRRALARELFFEDVGVVGHGRAGDWIDHEHPRGGVVGLRGDEVSAGALHRRGV